MVFCLIRSIGVLSLFLRYVSENWKMESVSHSTHPPSSHSRTERRKFGQDFLFLVAVILGSLHIPLRNFILFGIERAKKRSRNHPFTLSAEYNTFDPTIKNSKIILQICFRSHQQRPSKYYVLFQTHDGNVGFGANWMGACKSTVFIGRVCSRLAMCAFKMEIMYRSP